jgi:hypothetical protein
LPIPWPRSASRPQTILAWPSTGCTPRTPDLWSCRQMADGQLYVSSSRKYFVILLFGKTKEKPGFPLSFLGLFFRTLCAQIDRHLLVRSASLLSHDLVLGSGLVRDVDRPQPESGTAKFNLNLTSEMHEIKFCISILRFRASVSAQRRRNHRQGAAMLSLVRGLR